MGEKAAPVKMSDEKDFSHRSNVFSTLPLRANYVR